MPTNRRPIERPRRRQVLTAEAIALFAELENTPRRRRGSKAFKDREHELARMLNLVPEWWATCSVLDDSKRLCWPSHLQAYQDWHTVRSVREALLERAKAAT
jgi:hypothetical protein